MIRSRACTSDRSLPDEKGVLGKGRWGPQGIFLSVRVGISATEVFMYFSGFRGFKLAVLTARLDHDLRSDRPYLVCLPKAAREPAAG
jgi:hypothetical protein